MSEKPLETPSSDIYTISDVDLPTSSNELKQFLIEINDSINRKASNPNNQNNQINNLTFTDSKTYIDQTVLNSVFASNENSKDKIIENFQKRDKEIHDNPSVINLINIDQDLIHSNSKLKIIDNITSGTNRYKEKNHPIETISENSKNGKKPDINLIKIDKDFIDSNDPGSITIIQNVPLLIINHNCCDTENCKLKDDSYKNVILSEQDEDNNESIKESYLARVENIDEVSLSQIENKDSTLSENILNFQENTQDRSWSITSYHQYEEIITEEKINENSDFDSVNEKNEVKTLSQESSIHLGDEHDPNISNSFNEEEKEKKFESDSNNESKIDETENDNTLLEKNDSNKKINSTNDSNSISESKNSEHSSSKQDITESKEDLKKSLNSDDESIESSSLCSSKNKKSKKKNCCSETSSDSSSSCKLETSLSQGRSKDDFKESPLIESIDRIKQILSELIKELPNNQDKRRFCDDLNNFSRTNKTNNKELPSFQFDPNECKSSIKFVFPQINLPENSSKPSCNNKCNNPLSNNKEPRLNYGKNIKQNTTFPQHQNSLNQQPIWVLTRVTKHVTRTVRKEVIPC